MQCRFRHITLVIFVLLTAATSRGIAETWPAEYLFEESYVGDGDVQRSNKRLRNFDENNTLLQFVFTPRVKLGVLRLGVEYERFSFGFGDRAEIPDTLQSLSAIIGLDTELSDSIIVRIEAQPGSYGEEIGSGEFNVPFVIGGTYLYSPDLQFVFGIGVDVERTYPVLPGGGIRWKFQPQWVLDAVLPTPRLEYELNKNFTLYLGGSLKEITVRVDDRFGATRARPIPRLNDAVLTYSEVRVGAGFDWKITKWFSVNLETGYQPYRNFDFYRADVRYHHESGAPYGMIALHGAF